MRLRMNSEPTPTMIMNDITKLFHDKLRIECEKLGIRHTYHRTLFLLIHKGATLQSELVQMSHLKASSISVMLQKMENDGLIERVADEHDLRQTRIKATDKGIEINKMIRQQCGVVEEEFLKGIPKEDLDAFVLCAKKIRENAILSMNNK